MLKKIVMLKISVETVKKDLQDSLMNRNVKRIRFVFTVTFDQFNVALLNRSIHFLNKKYSFLLKKNVLTPRF